MDKPLQLKWYGNGKFGVVTDTEKLVMEPDLCRTAQPRARKQHTCCECKRRIEKGQHYELVEGLWNGDCWSRYKTCLECVEMRSYAVRHWSEGIPFGELHDHLADEVVSVLQGWEDAEQ